MSEIKNLSSCRSLLKLTQKFNHFRQELIMDGGEMYKKACRLLFCSLEPIGFQKFPLPSPSQFRKVPIITSKRLLLTFQERD